MTGRWPVQACIMIYVCGPIINFGWKKPRTIFAWLDENPFDHYKFATWEWHVELNHLCSRAQRQNNPLSMSFKMSKSSLWGISCLSPRLVLKIVIYWLVLVLLPLSNAPLRHRSTSFSRWSSTTWCDMTILLTPTWTCCSTKLKPHG